MKENIVKEVDHHDEHDHSHDDIPQLGFLTYLMTDVMLFGSLIATFIVLGFMFEPPKFDLNGILLSTMLLLTSSFTVGLALLYTKADKLKVAFFWFAVTWVLGAIFLTLEIHEFMWLIESGFGPSAHAYFSAFFVLVGTHGLHVTFGLFWMLALLIQLLQRGNNPITFRKLTIFGLFWHFLDIVWIFVFSIVYLIGAL